MKKLIKREQSKRVCNLKGKKVFMKDEEVVMNALKKGLKVEGRLWLEETEDGQLIICFQQYDRKPKGFYSDRLIQRLEHGWVKESKERIKLFESLPKVLGTSRVVAVIDREMREAKNALLDRELDMLEFC